MILVVVGAMVKTVLKCILTLACGMIMRVNPEGLICAKNTVYCTTLCYDFPSLIQFATPFELVCFYSHRFLNNNYSFHYSTNKTSGYVMYWLIRKR